MTVPVAGTLNRAATTAPATLADGAVTGGCLSPF